MRGDPREEGTSPASRAAGDLPADARVLVTGATGLIGRAVLEQLNGHSDVFAVSREPHAYGDVTWLHADLTRPGEVRKIVERVAPSVIVHLAGAVRGDRSLEAVRPTMLVNLIATVELLEAATRVGAHRIVVSGSLLEEPEVMSSSVIPSSPYGASRLASSEYARMFHALFGTPVAILRPSYVYGPGQEPTKLIPYLVTTLMLGESPELAAGDRRMDFVFSDDVARAYLAAATSDGVEGETIDIGSGSIVGVHEVVGAVLRLMGDGTPRPAFHAVPARPLEREVRVDTERALRLLDWRATTPLEDGLRRTVEWYATRIQSGPPREAPAI